MLTRREGCRMDGDANIGIGGFGLANGAKTEIIRLCDKD